MKKNNNSNYKQAKKKTKPRTNGKGKTVSTKRNFKNSQEKKKILLVCLIVLIALLMISYFTLGLLMTILMGLGILVILGIARLLDKTRNKPKQRKILNIVLIVFLSLAILGAVLICCFFVYIVVTAPKFDDSLLNPDEMSIMYDADGNEIAKLGGELRTKIKYEQLPQVFIDALVATEDSRFFQHNGFDAPRFLKASLGQIAGQSDAGGASTISMQVIKNRITGSESSGIKGIIRKFTDIYLAIFKLEKKYTKEQILEFYVNNHLLGGNVWGVQQAAQAYFSKDVEDLNLSEAATLAGMFKSPNYYRPNVNPKNATERRNTVLYLMEMHGYITHEEREVAAAIPMEDLVNVNTSAMTFGNAEYQGYIDTVVEELDEKYHLNPYTTPMLIYTNMVRSKQDAVNRVMSGNSDFNWVNDIIQGGVAVLDVNSGKIQAIGAERPNDNEIRQNYAFSMTRQPGSTAKPLFDYGPAFEYYNWSTYGVNDGDDNYSTLIDEPYSYSNGQSIGNWDGNYMGSMTIRRALSLSRNIPALKTFQMISTKDNGEGNKKILEFVTNLGITPEEENGRLHEAHAIGAFDPGVSPVTLAAAYAAFANGGTYYEPYAVEKFIVRGTGEETQHEEMKRKAMSDATAYMITSILQNVSLYGSTIPNVAAKTGTTNHTPETREKWNMAEDAVRDSWVVGYTTKTVIGSWYGYPEAGYTYCRTAACSNQRDLFFRTLASEVFESNKESFKVPDSVSAIQIGGQTEYFKKGHEPKKVESAKIATPSNLKATYDTKNDKVTITWNGVDPGTQLSTYGEFGYNVYFNNTLLGFTTKTSYTVSKPSTPYGTYKVVATFSKYNGNESNPATYTLSKPSVNLSIGPSTITFKGPIPVGDIRDAIYVKNNGIDVTNDIEITAISVDNKNMAFTNTLTAGKYTIKVTFKYGDETKTSGNITVIIQDQEEPGNTSPETTTP